MATSFPTGLDALTNPTSTDPLNSPPHADQHANVNDAVEALEAKVGVNGSAVTSSHDYKIAQLETNSISKTIIDAKGDLIAGSAADTAARLAASTTNGQVLTVDTTTATGLKWATPSDDIPKTLVDAKGDLLVGTAADTVGRLAVGSNGDLLVADSGATAGVRWQGQTNTGRNVIINGGLDVWQRGTSFTGASPFYSADRWQAVRGAAAAGLTCSRQTSGVDGFKYSARIQRDSGNTATDAMNFAQSFETSGVVGLYNQKITFSFYAKCGANYSSASSLLTVYIMTGTGTETNFAAGFTSAAYPIFTTCTLTTSYQKFSFTSSSVLPTTATQFAVVLAYEPVGTAGANDWYEVTGVQLEVGSVATGFDFEPYERTLAKCQRYYHKAVVNDVGDHFGSGFNKTTTVGMFFTQFPVTMRVAPTALEQTGTAANYSIAHANTSTAASAVPAFESATVNGASTNITVSSGLTAGQGSMARAANTAAYLGWSAEL